MSTGTTPRERITTPLDLELDQERLANLRRLAARMMADDLREIATEQKIDRHFRQGRFARLWCRMTKGRAR